MKKSILRAWANGRRDGRLSPVFHVKGRADRAAAAILRRHLVAANGRTARIWGNLATITFDSHQRLSARQSPGTRTTLLARR